MNFADALRTLTEKGADLEQAVFTVIAKSISSELKQCIVDTLSSHFSVSAGEEGEALYIHERVTGRRLLQTQVTDILERSTDLIGITTELLHNYFGGHSFSEAIPVEGDPVKISRAKLFASIPNNAVYSALQHEILAKLDRRENFLLLGPSASGKTVLAAQCASIAESRGTKFFYLDVNSSYDEFSRNFVSIIKSCQQHDKTSDNPPLIIIDNIQGSVRQFSKALTVLNGFSADQSSTPTFLYLGWPEAGQIELLQKQSPGSKVLDADAQARSILASNPFFSGDPRVLDDILSAIVGDCFIAKQISDTTSDASGLPSFEHIGRAILMATAGDDPISDNAVGALYLLSALGALEIYADRKWLQFRSGISSRELSSLVGLRQTLEQVSLGHRSKAFVLSKYLLTIDPTLSAKFGEIDEIVVEYCRTVGDAAVAQTIERLDLAEHQSEGQALVEWESMTLELWRAFLTIRSRILNVTVADPSWGANTASASFALTVLGQIDWGAWETCFKKVFAIWDCHSGMVALKGKVSERDDFDAIRERMKEEDASNHVAWEGYSEVDMDAMHVNWCLGLLLMALGSSALQDGERTASILAELEKRIGVLGEIHPKRVPWVAARVLSGLSSCGQNIHTSAQAKRISEWLLLDYPDGPFREDHWEAGTGSWNDSYQATAMAISALADAGIGVANQKIQRSTNFLSENKSEWMRPGKEITVIDVLIVKIKLGHDWKSYIEEIKFILEWLLSAEQWALSRTSILATEEGVESSKLAQVASRAYVLVFEILKASLGDLARFGTEKYSQIFSVLPERMSSIDTAEVDRTRSLIRYCSFMLNVIENELGLRAELMKEGGYDEATRSEFKDAIRVLAQQKELVTRAQAELAVGHANLTHEEIDALKGIGRKILNDDVTSAFDFD
ncbi:ATP-binding protein [Planktotalea sp.]|uniref:ATP-binding protein n=1 Tax=Planktotalea sp. TaxID=2029877 RepID=UPI003D6A939A